MRFGCLCACAFCSRFNTTLSDQVAVTAAGTFASPSTSVQVAIGDAFATVLRVVSSSSAGLELEVSPAQAYESGKVYLRICVSAPRSSP
jgi:hypothetical protein